MWSLTLVEERKLQMAENGMLKKVFGDKRDEEVNNSCSVHNARDKIVVM
jgi:hypothetical protein